MESPTTLLNTAIHESEGPERMAKVIKACKMITDILPFDKRNHILLDDSDLMKCLMLSLPLNPRAIDLIILSMIHKFQSSHHFLKEMWLGFTFIANMDESEWNASRKYDGSFKNYYSATRKQHTVQSRDIDDSFGSNQGAKTMSYCQEIERNKPTIKLYALKYAEQIIDLLIHSKVRLAVPFRPDIPFLLKTFLIFTNNEKAIIKTCTILETVRQADPKSTIDHEIEEIIVNKTKRASFLASPTQETVESAMLKSNVGTSTIQKRRLERADSGNSASLGGTPLIKLGDTDRLQVIEETQAIETSQHLSSNNHYGSQDYYEDSFEIDNIGGRVSEQDIITLDRWLCDWEIDEVPLFTKGEHIQDIIQRRENFEALLSFVIDPRLYAVSEIWRRRHKKAIDEYEGEDFGTRTPTVDSPTNLNQFDRLKENRTFHPYMIRSYKAMQVLCDLRNFKYLMQIQKEGLETFCNKIFGLFLKIPIDTNLYVTCIAREKNLCNFNHLAKLTEFFVRKEFHESTRFLIQFNLPFKFLQNISFQYVQHLFLTLFGCSEHIKEQDPGAISKVLEYCKISQFFLDLANAILTGPEILDPKKYDIEYKPQGVGPLLKATTDGNVFFFSVDERPTAYEMEVQEVCFPEETKGFVIDIDYLQPVLKAKKNVDFKKLKSMKTRFLSEEDGGQSPKKSNPKVSSKDISTKRYPSLVEKGFYANIEPPLREIKLNSKQRLDLEGEVSDRERMNQSRGMHKRNSKSTSNAFEDLKLLSKPGTAMKGMTRLNLVQEGKTLSDALTPDSLKNALLAKTANMTPTAGIMKKPIGSSIPQTPKTPNNEVQFFNKAAGQPIKLTPLAPNSVKGSEKKLLLSNFEPENGRNQMIATAPVTVRANSLTKQPSLLVKKPSLADGYSTPSMMDMKIKSTSKLDFRIHSRTRLGYGSQGSLGGDPKGPSQVTVARELRTDTIDRNNLLRLNNLYPLSRRDLVLADLDSEAKKPVFSMSGIKGNEHYSLSGCEMLEEMFRRAFLIPQKKDETERAPGAAEEEEEKRKMKKHQDMKEIGIGEIDHTELWSTVFSENYQVFELLLKNYLLKIKMNTIGENNSGYVSGRIINMILEKCAQNHKYMEPHKEEILNICKKHFQYLCKMIIQSHAWGPKEGVNPCLQDYQVKDLLDTGRLLLVNTLKFIIQCDQPNQYSVIYLINDTCWHTLTLWFFTKKTNNIYQQLFYTLFNIILYSTTEKLIVNLLFKINMVSSMYQAWGDICKNKVILRDNHIDSMLYFLKKMYNQIDVLAEDVLEYKALREQLFSSASWHDLKSHLLIPRKKKRKTVVNSKDSDRKLSRMSTRGSVTQVNRNSIMRTSSVPKQLENINESPIHSQRSSTSTVFHPDGVLEFPKIHQSSLVKFT